MINKIALQLPWFSPSPGTPDAGNTFIPGPPGFRFNDQNTINPGYITSQVLEYVFFTASFLVFLYALYGAIQYILAGGDKEKLAKARNRIQWAFFGFIFLLISFALSQYIQQIFPANNPNVINVVSPSVLPAINQNPPPANQLNPNQPAGQPAGAQQGGTQPGGDLPGAQPPLPAGGEDTITP